MLAGRSELASAVRRPAGRRVGTIDPSPDQEGAPGRSSPEAEEAAKRVRDQMNKLNDELKAAEDRDKWWNQMGARLSNLGFLSKKFEVSWPVDQSMKDLVRDGARNYCTRRGYVYPKALDQAEMDVTGRELNDFAGKLNQEHDGETEATP